jgi:hypothetical protein
MTTSFRSLSLALAFSVTCGLSRASAQVQDSVPQLAVVLQQYEQQRKSGWTAGFLEYLLPLLGYSCAGDWRRGLWPAWLWISGGLLMTVPCTYVEDCTDSDWELILVGLTAVVASRVWGVVGAVHTAQDYNRALRVRLNIEPTAQGLSAGVAVPFR